MSKQTLDIKIDSQISPAEGFPRWGDEAMT